MLRRYILTLALACVSTSLGAADCKKCDCNHWPWKDECDTCCSLKALNNSSPRELRYFLKVDDSLRKDILALKAKQPTTSVDDLERNLTPEQIKRLADQIESLPALQRSYLLATPSEKKDIGNDIQQANKPATMQSGPRS